MLLLHGHPRTSATWHRVAPKLVEHCFAVVCIDLRGYGRSGPVPTADHIAEDAPDDLVAALTPFVRPSGR